MGDNSLVNWRLEPQHCKEHAHMVVVLPKKIVAKQRGVTKKKSSPFEYIVVWAPQIVKVSKYTSTPSPWLTRIRFTRISLTRIFKKFPFLT